MEEDQAILEALIFSSENPLSIERMRDVLPHRERQEILHFLQNLAASFAERQGGFLLREIAGGWQFYSRPDLAAWIRKLRAGRPQMLSPAALETLAVIAYRQPVVKADIDRIRGVDVGGTLKGLLEKRLVRMVGRKDVPGKPMLYGTTKRFLEVFQLRDLSELPTLTELKEIRT